MRVLTAEMDRPAALVERKTEMVLVFQTGLLSAELVAYLAILLDRV
jgi:hypothetical protein